MQGIALVLRASYRRAAELCPPASSARKRGFGGKALKASACVAGGDPQESFAVCVCVDGVFGDSRWKLWVASRGRNPTSPQEAGRVNGAARSILGKVFLFSFLALARTKLQKTEKDAEC